MVNLTPEQRRAAEQFARDNAGISVLKDKKKYVAPSMPWMRDLMAWQRDVIDDPCRTKALLCGRRTGKTYLLVYYLLYKSLIKPNSTCFYIALSLGQAKGLIWKDLKNIIENYNIPAKINNTDFNVVFNNGSKISLKGCGDRREADKFRGYQYDLVAIDEVSSFGSHIMTS